MKFRKTIVAALLAAVLLSTFAWAASPAGVRFDFETGDSGFTPIYADYPVGNGVDEFYELQHSWGAVPDGGSGLFLSGNNHSDDLFMGYVKKLACEEANRTGAVLYEIKAAERTEGTLGFWWCGRYGMHRWAMPIEKIPLTLSDYAHVTICSPIWVFALAAPVRSFCKLAAGQIREADYILVHHQKSDYVNAAEEMDTLLGIRRTGLRSVQCRLGVYRAQR